MNQPIDELKAHFAKLVAHRDSNDKPMTQQAMADKLNAKGIQSLSGQPWSKYSVRRMLSKLQLSESSSTTGRPAAKSTAPKSGALSDNEIRARIRQGLYDTETECFIAQPADEKSKKKKKKGKKDKKKK